MLFAKGSENVEDGMTDTEFSVFLELLAQLVECKAKTPEEAAAIIRNAKPQP